MNISLLAKYNSYSFPARSLTRLNRIRQNQSAPVKDIKNTFNNVGAINKGLFINHYPSKLIKRVGYTELNGNWDQFIVTRFVDLIERNTGKTLDASTIMRKYDTNGDGLLNMDEQTAMIEGLTKAEYGKAELSQSVLKSIVDMLNELSGQNERKDASSIQRAVRRYERLFLFENQEIPEENTILAV